MKNKIRVLNGGIGCLIANGVVGEITTRERAIKNESKYSGEFLDRIAPLYVRGDDGICYGLCDGYIVEKIDGDISVKKQKPITYTEEELFDKILLFANTFPKLFINKLKEQDGIPERDVVVREWFDNNKKK